MEGRFETFTTLITKISRNVRKIKNSEMAKYNLRSPHVMCLYYLYCNEGLTATELCEKCEEDKATVSRTMDYFEKNGYIACDFKTTKKYKSPLVLTDKGREAGKLIAARVDCILDEVGVGLSDAERAEFYRCLSIISDNLEAISKTREEITGE